MIKPVIRIALVLVMILGARVAFADENPASEVAKKSVITKTIDGEVSGVSSIFLAILYGQDKKSSYEMALTMDQNTRVERKKSLKEIKTGDIVTVKYEEIIQIDKEKTEKGEVQDVTRVLGRLAKVVTFIRAQEGLQAEEELQVELVDKEGLQEGELQE